MKRTTIWLTDPQVKKLAAVSKKKGITVAEQTDQSFFVRRTKKLCASNFRIFF